MSPPRSTASQSATCEPRGDRAKARASARRARGCPRDHDADGRIRNSERVDGDDPLATIVGGGQYSFLMTKNEPRMVPASLDFCLANLNFEASSVGTSIPSDSLKPTARFLASSMVYITLIERPLS
jgi:hypothetical protein